MIEQDKALLPFSQLAPTLANIHEYLEVVSQMSTIETKC